MPPSPRPRLGAVTFLHRFGSGLNRHAHLHAVVTDGVFLLEPAGPDGPAAFLPTRPLTAADLAAQRAAARHDGRRPPLQSVAGSDGWRSGPDGRISRIRYLLPRHKVANWIGPARPPQLGQASMPVTFRDLTQSVRAYILWAGGTQ